MLVGEHAEGLEVDALAGLEVVAELLLRVLQVGNGLVEVGVQVAVVQRGVGLDVVGVLNDVELDARVRGQVVVDVGEDLRVGRGGRAHGQGDDVRGGAGSVRGGAAAAGRQAQGGNGRQADSCERAVTHDGSLFFCVLDGMDGRGRGGLTGVCQRARWSTRRERISPISWMICTMTMMATTVEIMTSSCQRL